MSTAAAVWLPNTAFIPIGGIIDTDYRGEPMIILLNTGTEPYTIHGGDKIAQIECPFPYKAVFEEVSPEKFADLAQTIRGNGGFGSTGRR